MDFISGQFSVNTPGDVAPRDLAPPKAERERPIGYRSIEAFAICTDLAIILLASVLSTLLHRIHSGWTGTDLGKAVGSAMVVSALFVCLLKIYGKYRPTELLVMRDQIRAVFLAWIFVFFLLADAVGTLKSDSEVSRGAGLVFALVGFAMLIGHSAIIEALLRKSLRGRKFAGSNIVLITNLPQSHHAGLAQTPAMFGFSREGPSSRTTSCETCRSQNCGPCSRNARRQDDQREYRTDQINGSLGGTLEKRERSALQLATIDESPQLFNVLDGNMSLVGPRPLDAVHDDLFGNGSAELCFPSAGQTRVDRLGRGQWGPRTDANSRPDRTTGRIRPLVHRQLEPRARSRDSAPRLQSRHCGDITPIKPQLKRLPRSPTRF